MSKSSPIPFCTDHTWALFVYHCTVLLWGVTAILGKLISYDSFTLVWHRMTITCLVYALLPATWRELKELEWSNIGRFFGTGLIVCVHWLTFFGCIHLSDSASIALACFGSLSFFTAILDPLLGSAPFSKVNLAIGIVVLGGLLQVYMSLPQGTTDDNITGDIDYSASSTSGISSSNSSSSGASGDGGSESSAVAPGPKVYYGWAIVSGLVSSFLAALFCVLNKVNIERGTPLTIAFIEMGAGALLLWVVVPIMYGVDTRWYPTVDVHNLTIDTIRTGEWDLIWVTTLAVCCTNITFYSSNYSLGFISSFTANMASNLEPVYGIMLGALIFHENKQLNIHFYIGTTIIIISIFASSVYTYLCEKAEAGETVFCCPEEHDAVGDISLDDDGSSMMIEMGLKTAPQRESEGSGRERSNSDYKNKQMYSHVPTSELNHEDGETPMF